MDDYARYVPLIVLFLGAKDPDRPDIFTAPAT